MTTYQLTPLASVRYDQLTSEVQAQLPTVVDVGGAGGTVDAYGLIWASPARMWATSTVALTSQQQATLASIVAAHVPAESLDEKLASLQQVVKTLAACVEALVTAKTNQPALFTNVQPWVTTQITNAHTFIKNQGG